MKKFKLLASLLALVLVFTACDSSDSDKKETEKKEENLEYTDGVYYVVDETSGNGWKQFLTFEIVDGKVTNVDYDAYHMRDGDSRSKSVRGEEGDYNLPEGSLAPIQEQFEYVEGLIESGDILDVEFDSEGAATGDAASGATIKFSNAKDMFESAIANGPVAQAGTMEDGYYFGQAEADDKGNIAQVVYVVFDGNIVSAEFDSLVPGDEEDSYKSVLSKDGEYDLGEEAVAAMHEQLMTLNDVLIENQSFEYELTDGKTDAISGATVSIDVYQEAFNNAKKQ